MIISEDGGIVLPKWLADLMALPNTQVNVNFNVDVVSESDTIVVPPGDDVVVPPDVPDTRLVEMTEKEQYKKPVGEDDAGKPIMEGGIVGFKAEIGERFLVEVPSVQASGGAQYYKVWLGDNNDTSARGWYIAKDKTKVV